MFIENDKKLELKLLCVVVLFRQNKTKILGILFFELNANVLEIVEMKCCQFVRM